MSNTIHYLPAAIIALLLVVVAMLVWMLQQAVRKQRGLEEKIELLQTKIQQEERKDTGSKEEEERLKRTLTGVRVLLKVQHSFGST